MTRKINVANPGDKSTNWPAYLLAFGACGTTYVLAYASDLESALETAAEWLADNAPGHIMLHDSDELESLYQDAIAEAQLPQPCLEPFYRTPAEQQAYDDAYGVATADLTYTEAGYLTSYEWFIVSEDIGPAELRKFVQESR